VRVWTFHLETDVAFRLFCDNQSRHADLDTTSQAVGPMIGSTIV